MSLFAFPLAHLPQPMPPQNVNLKFVFSVSFLGGGRGGAGGVCLFSVLFRVLFSFPHEPAVHEPDKGEVGRVGSHPIVV